jgi:hypothetical protein
MDFNEQKIIAVKESDKDTEALCDDLFLQKVAKKEQLLPQERVIKKTDSFFMFWSKGDRNANLNESMKDEDNNLISCRHIAGAYLSHNKEKLNKSYHEAFNNLSEIPFLYENRFDKDGIMDNAMEFRLININNIGRELSMLSANMEDNTLLEMFFSSENHLMSIKIKNEGTEGFVINFFDPNHTLVHKNIWFANAEKISALKIEELLDERHIKAYFPKLNGFLAIEPHIEYLESHCSPKYVLGSDVSFDDELCYGFGLRYAPWISRAVKGILASDLSNEEKENLLIYKGVQGDIALCVALYNDYDEISTLYAKLIADSDLKNKHKNNILACKYDDISILYIALLDNHYQVVSKYVTLITKLKNLDNEQKENLLECKDLSGVPGLYIALENGCVEAVISYVLGVLNSNLSDKQKENLLACIYDGIPGFYAALECGNSSVIDAYMPLILGSSLNNDLKERLVACRESDGTPGLFAALAMGHAQSVATYINFIANSNLSDKSKENLLLAENTHGIFGIYIALENGDHETVKTHFKEMKKLKMSSVLRCIDGLTENVCEEDKENLLQAFSNYAPELFKLYMNKENAILKNNDSYLRFNSSALSKTEPVLICNPMSFRRCG